MEPTQFWTKLVTQRKDITVRLSEVGGILFLAGMLLMPLSKSMNISEDWAMYGLVMGAGLALIGLSMRRGKPARPIVTDTDVVISSREIRIGDRSFAINQLEYLDFLVNSYHGMRGPRMRFRRMTLGGVDNKLYFTLAGKKHAYTFYLEDQRAMQRLGLLFREFYRDRIPFRERNRGGRTFLFEQVLDRKHFEAAKSQEGYE